LALAIGTGVAFDVVLLVSFGWSELIGPNLRSALWAAFGVCWLVATAWSVRQCGRRAKLDGPDHHEDVFSTALDHYLKGDYYQAEQVFEGLLRRNIRDLDARLMLATLLRHAGRHDEATHQLDTLARFEGAEKWELEIGQERQLLAKAKTAKAAAA
jgi:tetratricopeptide (TPR) repeat protein